MPITNLVWLTSASDAFTSESKAAMAGAFDAQAGWVADHVPSAPKDREARGVALFQQVEDPRVVMETAHWTSGDEHATWLASEEYKASSAPLAAHFDFSKLEYFHLDTDAFRAAGAGEESLLRSPVVSVARAQVPVEKKAEFVKAWDTGVQVLAGFAKPRVVRFGYRVPKRDPETEEFVIFVGWPTVEQHGEFANSDGFINYANPLRELAMALDVKHYKRVL